MRLSRRDHHIGSSRLGKTCLFVNGDESVVATSLLVDDFAMITPDLLRQVRRGCTGEQTEKKRETVGATVAVYAVALRSIVSDNHTFALHISKTNMPNLNARFVPTS